MKSRSSTGSPLRRWLVGHDARPHVEASGGRTDAATDNIVLAHWILYGVRPSAEGMSYWGQRLDGRSLFEVMHTMHRSSAPNRQFEWRRFYRAIGVGGARSEKAPRSPALAAIRVHLAYEGTEPEPRIVAGYLRALLRRPVDMGSFSGHVIRRVLRRRGERAGRSSARMPFAKPIPVDVIRSEVLLLEAIAQPNHDDNVFGLLVRALTPVPDGTLETEVVETKPPVGKFDRILTAANVDLRKLERDLLAHARSEKKDIGESHADFLLNSIYDQIEDRSPGLLLVILYRLLLRRDPEESGYAYHLAALEEGRVTPKAVVVDFLKSTEFKSKRDSIGGHNGA